MKLFTILLFLFSTLCKGAELTSGTLVLLQPDEELQTKELDLAAFAAYTKLAQSKMADIIKPVKLEKSNGFIVFAVREGNQSNAWLDMKPSLPTAIEDKIISSIRTLTPFHVAHGTVVYAIKVMINGASQSAEETPYPSAWQKAMASQNEAVETEELVKLVWPIANHTNETHRDKP